MTDSRLPPDTAATGHTSGPEYRRSDRFWPYVEPAEQPSAEELATLDPDLRDALFGPEERPFSITLSFPRFEGDDYDQALKCARAAAEYREVGHGESLRHRARYYPDAAAGLKQLFEIVSRHECEVLVDDRPVPFARELWLPLWWFLIPRE